MVNVHKLKQEICEIGDRIYKKGFAAANDGNITYRVGENEVLCTPTLHCKGFLKPEDICTVDMEGNQTAGIKKRSSEALLHLEIMKRRPRCEERGALPSTSCDCLCRGPRADSSMCVARGGSVSWRRADYKIRNPRRAGFRGYDFAVCRKIERYHSGQPRYSELRRGCREGLLVGRRFSTRIAES